MKTNRRDFIKISSAGVAVAAITPPLVKWASASAKSNSEISEDGLRRTPTYCEVCFWKCAGWVYTDENNNIKKIIGHEDDPHCNGRLCPRGTGGVGMYSDEDRLKKPMIRTNVRGKQEFKEVSWDEALDYVAEKMQKIKRKYGPECVALFNHGTGGKQFSHMLNAYGSANVSAPSYGQCRGPREVGFVGTFGESIGSPEPCDIRDTKCLVLIGSHLGENMHNGPVQEMAEAIDRGASIITVDPRFSTAASKSKFWLPIKPATDNALLLAWIHVLIYEGWFDKEFVEKYTYGFEDLKKHVKNMTPEWAYGITTIKPDVIRKTAKEMFNASPSVIIHPGRHATWYGDDTQRSRLMAMLNA
ncbi:MAG: molybdopterin-dependent oxidoreductase, partial [Bacteroidetes bacterium]|nr:molybdopterin-dependent oxidoreductase [Bacteroidota bacterium]